MNELFQSATRDGVQVVQRTVSLSEIREAVLEQKHLIIVLLDKRLLKCAICDRSEPPVMLSSSAMQELGFLGHYVLLYAYDPRTDMFLMKDPATECETCTISGNNLEESRVTFGTDQDIIFIGGIEEERVAEGSSTRGPRG